MNNDKSFIEVQFPVSKVSKESYKERKAVQSQTLTGLGKWWGRKPLILIRATLLGLIMPATNNPKKDREIFLKILTMDEEGLIKRKKISIPPKQIFNFLTSFEKKKYFKEVNGKFSTQYRAEITKEEKDELQYLIFKRLTYDEKLAFCVRPEDIHNLDYDTWAEINNYLGTDSKNLQDLFKELGEKKFGKEITVGDCFSGGGSTSFEAARLGCNVYASDLNPLSVLLTWSNLHIAGASEMEEESLKEFQQKVFDLVDNQLLDWGIETNEQGDRANCYLYCNETNCPECGYLVPLLPTLVVGKSSKVIAQLVPTEEKEFEIIIKSDCTDKEMKEAESSFTLKDNKVYCPNCNNYTPITTIRRERKDNDNTTISGLRKWESFDFIPRETDIFQERLYCIRYEHVYLDENENTKKERYFTAPTTDDLLREKKVIEILEKNLIPWQEVGYIPSSQIEEGYNTNQPIRERGWKYWHQLFSPRQLLIHGLFMKYIDVVAKSNEEKVIGLLGVNKMCNWNSKLCQWGVGAARESIAQTFYNQALNTIYNYGVKGLSLLTGPWFLNFSSNELEGNDTVNLVDARNIEHNCELWITDPPYADAVNYHELSEFFLAWNKKLLKKVFPEWYTDSKRVLAVKGTGEEFNKSMIEIYSNLASHMHDEGMQVVMFTHQDVKVWAELSLILWSAGLQVVAAWNIATETEASGLKHGNYVKGTVLLVLKKQTSEETAYLDELYPDVEDEVINQINNMRNLDDKEDPNFSDPDYLLAAYAASLKILTSYKKIEDIDVQYELSKSRNSNEESPIVKIIQEAVKIAYDYMIPTDFDNYVWKTLTSEERFYIKGLELEKNNVYQISGYQELARGFGVNQYSDLLQNTKANNARLKTPSEFSMRGLSDTSKFSISLLRKVLVAIYLSVKEEDTRKGRNWLKTEVENYWTHRSNIMTILSYIASIEYIENMEHWRKDAYTASILKELIDNDGV